MVEKVGSIYYEVTLDTRRMIESQRGVDTQVARTAGSLERVGDAADKAGRKFDGFRTKITAVAGAVASLAAAMFLVAQSDAYTKLNAQLELATGGTKELAAAQRVVISIAQEAQTDLSSIAVLYARITNATKELGASQRVVGEITRVVALSMKVSGASAEESASAMLQLSQAFAAGALRGEEYNSVSEAAPRLMKALADGLGVPIGQLRSMANEGKLTSKVLAEALPKALAQLEVEAKSVQTIGGAFQELRNEVMLFIGAQMESSGAAKLTASAIASLSGMVKDLGSSFDTFLTAAETGAVAFAGVMAGRFVASVRESTIALLANVEGTKAAAAAEVLHAKTMQTTAFEALAKATSVRAGALATAELAAANLAAARSEVQLAAAEVERTGLAAALAIGTKDQATQALVAKIANDRLTAAKLAETEATVALTAAERALTIARGQEAAAATIATTSTVALTAAQRAQAAASYIAAAAGRAFTAVVAAMGGPVGIAIIALGLLVMNWDKIGASAKTAAQITEESTARIQKATSRAAEAPMRQLMKARDDAEANIARLDAEIQRAEKWAKSGEGRWGKDATQVDTSDLDAQREDYRGALLDTQKAIDDFKKQQLTDLFPEPDKPLKDPPKTKEQLGKAQEAQAYYQSLVAANATAYAKINAEEAKALAENQKRMIEDAANAGVYGKAKVEIQKKFARERALLEEQTTEEVADLNIAITGDEAKKIELIRVEAIRRAGAQAKLGVRTEEQGARDKARAEYEAKRDLAALTERLDQEKAENAIAAATDELVKIDLIRQENLRRTQAAYDQEKISLDQKLAAEQRATIEAQNAIRQQLLSVNPLAALEQEYQSKLAIVSKYEELMAQAGVDGAAFVEQKRTELATQYQQQRQQLMEAEFIAQGEGQKFVVDTLNSLASTASSTITGLITGTMSAADAMRNLGMVVLNEAVGALVQVGLQYIKNAIMSQAADRAMMASKAANAALYTAAVTAQVGVTTALAAQAAFASTAAIPIVGPFAAPAAAAAAAMAAGALGAPAIVGAPIAGARMYGGNVNSDALYRVGEKGPEMFTANNGNQYMVPGQGGRVTPNDKLGGNGGGWQIIINNAPPGTTASVNNEQRIVEVAVAAAISDISGQVASNSGQFYNALTGSTNVRGQLS